MLQRASARHRERHLAAFIHAHRKDRLPVRPTRQRIRAGTTQLHRVLLAPNQSRQARYRAFQRVRRRCRIRAFRNREIRLRCAGNFTQAAGRHHVGLVQLDRTRGITSRYVRSIVLHAQRQVNRGILAVAVRVRHCAFHTQTRDQLHVIRIRLVSMLQRARARHLERHLARRIHSNREDRLAVRRARQGVRALATQRHRIFLTAYQRRQARCRAHFYRVGCRRRIRAFRNRKARLRRTGNFTQAAGRYHVGLVQCNRSRSGASHHCGPVVKYAQRQILARRRHIAVRICHRALHAQTRYRLRIVRISVVRVLQRALACHRERHLAAFIHSYLKDRLPVRPTRHRIRAGTSQRYRIFFAANQSRQAGHRAFQRVHRRCRICAFRNCEIRLRRTGNFTQAAGRYHVGLVQHDRSRSSASRHCGPVVLHAQRQVNRGILAVAIRIRHRALHAQTRYRLRIVRISVVRVLQRASARHRERHLAAFIHAHRKDRLPVRPTRQRIRAGTTQLHRVLLAPNQSRQARYRAFQRVRRRCRIRAFRNREIRLRCAGNFTQAAGRYHVGLVQHNRSRSSAS